MQWLRRCRQSFKKWKNQNNWWIFGKKKRTINLPPDFDKIPEPGSINDENDEDKEKIQKILKLKKDKKSDSKSSSIENEILNKIRKWKIKTYLRKILFLKNT